MIAQKLKQVQKQIQDICQRLNRLESEITLIGVTKYSSVADIQKALDAGLEDIAENRVHLALEKFPQLIHTNPVRQHLIGHLQTNKVKEAVAVFDLIHSVDSLKLMKEINKRAQAIQKKQEVLIQLDIAQEEQKFGLPLAQMDDMIHLCRDLPYVRVKGLMTMAPFTEDQTVIRDVFKTCRQRFESLRLQSLPWVDMKELSMGMSSDMEIAIEQGSTMLRIGSSIFQ